MTPTGAVRGARTDDDVWCFHAMPYARAPVGALRFAPPQPTGFPIGEVFDATTVGPTPPQGDHPRLHLYPPMSEDCLRLSVWTPGADAGTRPVMVWIHGGGWLEEAASDTVYDGSRLAARGDVVVVNVEYRLNAFGFTHLSNEPGSGNVGLLDQLEALRWIQNHIAHFGGDKNNVTIFGESAGGMSVSALLGMPAAGGLFHKAIMQSNVASAMRRPDFATTVTRELMAAASRTRKRSIGDAAGLRSLRWEEIVEASEAMIEATELTSDLLYGPVHDGAVFPEAPMRATAAGLNADIPILLGTTRTESRFWMSLDPDLGDLEIPAALLVEALASAAIPEDSTVEQTVAFYTDLHPHLEPLLVGLTVIDDVFFHMPIVRQAEAHAFRGQAPAYVYRFDWEPTVPTHPDMDFGSPHAAELGFTLGNPQAYPEMYGDSWSEPLLEQMMDTWISFATTSNPNNARLPDWQPYGLTSRCVMIFDADQNGTTSAPVSDPNGARRTHWESIPFDGLRPAMTPTNLTSGS